jgi:hypothetical protein
MHGIPQPGIRTGDFMMNCNTRTLCAAIHSIFAASAAASLKALPMQAQEGDTAPAVTSTTPTT